MAKEIESYLTRHPNAADSAEGVMRWWLSQQRYEETIQLVQKALELLVAQGHIEKSVTPGGKAVYSRLDKLPGTSKSH